LDEGNRKKIVQKIHQLAAEILERESASYISYTRGNPRFFSYDESDFRLYKCDPSEKLVFGTQFKQIDASEGPSFSRATVKCDDIDMTWEEVFENKRILYGTGPVLPFFL